MFHGYLLQKNNYYKSLGTTGTIKAKRNHSNWGKFT